MIDKILYLLERLTGYALDFEPGSKRPSFVPVESVVNGRIPLVLLIISAVLIIGWLAI